MNQAWVGERIKELAFTQQQVAGWLGWDRSKLNRLINGSQPLRFDDVVPLARVLRLEPTELLRRCGWPVPASDIPGTLGHEPLLQAVIAAAFELDRDRIAEADPEAFARAVLHTYWTWAGAEAPDDPPGRASLGHQVMQNLHGGPDEAGGT